MAKFEVGEIAEHRDGETGVWQECEILALPRGEKWYWRDGLSVQGDEYVIDIPKDRNPQGDGTWAAWGSHLRKRRPPEEPAEDEFQQEFKRWIGAGSPCPKKGEKA